MKRAQCVVWCGLLALTSCSAVKVEVNGKEMTLNEALGGVEGGGDTHDFTLDARTRVSSSSVSMPLSTAIATATELGYSCEPSGTLVMNPPIARLTIAHAQRVSLSLTEGQNQMGWVVVADDGTHLCGARDTEGVNKMFEPGVYTVHAAWTSGNIEGMKARARQPDRPVMSLFIKTYGVDGASEELVMDEQTQNPYYANGASYQGGFVAAGELGFPSKCERLGVVSAQPVMEIVVASKTPTLEVVGDSKVTWATVSEDGGIQCDAPKITKPGRYKIHAVTHAEKVISDEYFIFSPVFWDQSREVTLTGEVPKFVMNGLKAPIVIKGVTRPEEATRVNACMTQDAKISFEPDFFLKFERPTPNTRVLLIPETQETRQEFVVEDITTQPLLMSSTRMCERVQQPDRFGRTRYSLGTADGTYAGFVAHVDGPQDFVAIVWADETTIDPWMTVGEIPQDTTQVDERVFPMYYPLFHDAKINELEAWKHVSTALHVYVKERAVATRSQSQSAKVHARGGDPLEVRPGEALLLVDVLDRRKAGQPGKVRVWTSDGWDMVIDGYKLTTAHPDTWE